MATTTWPWRLGRSSASWLNSTTVRLLTRNSTTVATAARAAQTPTRATTRDRRTPWRQASWPNRVVGCWDSGIDSAEVIVGQTRDWAIA